MFIELNNYKKFHLIEKKNLTKIEKDFQPPFINPKFNYNKKSVLLVTGSLQAGGAERQIVNLAKTLSSSGFVVSIYLFSRKIPHHNPYYKLLCDNNINILTPNPCFDRKCKHFSILSNLPSYLREWTWGIYNAINDNQPSIIHSFLDWSNIMTGLASILLGHPNTNLSFRCTSPNNLAGHKLWFKRYYKLFENFENLKFSGNSIVEIMIIKIGSVENQTISYTPNILNPQ